MNHSIRITLLALAFILCLVVCSTAQSVSSRAYDAMLSTLLTHSVDEVDVEELKNDDRSFIYLDARERSEFDVSHIQDARWIGYEDFDARRLEGIDRNAAIVVYCSVGYRSEKISEKLGDLGYENVQNLYGGIFEWVNDGNQVVNNNDEVTKEVHAYDKIWGAWLNEGEKIYSK